MFRDFGNFPPLVPRCKLRLMSENDLKAQSPRPMAPLALQPAAVPALRDSHMTQGLSAKRYNELQSAMRFPIKLPLSVKSQAGQNCTQTENISANGVLFRLDAEMPIGSSVDFTISIPAEVAGSDADVRVDCRGRVARNFEDGDRRGIGVVIDEYHFERH